MNANKSADKSTAPIISTQPQPQPGEFDGHTLGPWRVVNHPFRGNVGQRITVDASNGILADVDWNAPTTNAANARLIASAPTLLKERDALRAQLDSALDALRLRTADRDTLLVALKRCEQILSGWSGWSADAIAQATRAARAALAAQGGDK